MTASSTTDERQVSLYIGSEVRLGPPPPSCAPPVTIISGNSRFRFQGSSAQPCPEEARTLWAWSPWQDGFPECNERAGPGGLRVEVGPQNERCLLPLPTFILLHFLPLWVVSLLIAFVRLLSI
jgi:hypothetical protein